MLENIKSVFFYKFVLSFLKEGKKLKIAKYNKKFQNIAEISLINYIFFSRKYIKYERKNFGKEFDSKMEKEKNII